MWPPSGCTARRVPARGRHEDAELEEEGDDETGDETEAIAAEE